MQFKLYAGVAVGVALLTLLCLTLWYRGQAIGAAGSAKLAKQAVEVMGNANKVNSETIRLQERNRQNNDRIVAKLATDVQSIKLRGSQERETIREIYRNDPQAKRWADLPIPGGVQRTLNASGG